MLALLLASQFLIVALPLRGWEGGGEGGREGGRKGGREEKGEKERPRDRDGVRQGQERREKLMEKKKSKRGSSLLSLIHPVFSSSPLCLSLLQYITVRTHL